MLLNTGLPTRRLLFLSLIKKRTEYKAFLITWEFCLHSQISLIHWGGGYRYNLIAVTLHPLPPFHSLLIKYFIWLTGDV